MKDIFSCSVVVSHRAVCNEDADLPALRVAVTMDVIFPRAETGDVLLKGVQTAGAEIDDADADGAAVELGRKLRQTVGAKVGSGTFKVERCVPFEGYADVRDASVGLQHDGGGHAVVSILECLHLHCAGVSPMSCPL